MRIVAFLYCVAFVSGSEMWKEFESFVQKFEKRYDTLEDFVDRFRIF